LPLTLVAGPVVEPGPLLVVPLAHVPLADVRGVVAGVVQALRIAGHVRRELREVVDHLMAVRVQAAQEAGPARRAQRTGAERVPEPDALVRDPIDVRGLE